MSTDHDTPTTPLQRTPLFDLHVEKGGKMVPFAGYEMPVQYPAGILTEHNHTREKCSLFDVSHMGQVVLKGDRRVEAVEALMPGDIQGLPGSQMRYTQLTDANGGIIDDLMVSNFGDRLGAVLNAGCKDGDIAHIRAHLPVGCELVVRDDLALLALQGPKAAEVLARMAPAARHIIFMNTERLNLAGIECMVARSGYTGEDGYEISVPADQAEFLARQLLEEDEVELAGLGARDSLRLEAGLCLYGNDIDRTTTPIEAGLLWSIGKRRREEGGFPGAAKIIDQIKNGASRRLVGLKPDGKAPVRAHAVITDTDGKPIGEVTSGGFGPTVGGPVAMGYVDIAYAKAETPVAFEVRGKSLPGRVVKMPLVAHRYYRG